MTTRSRTASRYPLDIDERVPASGETPVLDCRLPASLALPSPRSRRVRRVVKIYTRKGDDGTTALLYGGRVPKDSPAPTAYGDVDEAQAFLGLARAQCPRGGELD